jgi:hypothetical protein
MYLGVGGRIYCAPARWHAHVGMSRSPSSHADRVAHGAIVIPALPTQLTVFDGEVVRMNALRGLIKSQSQAEGLPLYWLSRTHTVKPTTVPCLIVGPCGLARVEADRITVLETWANGAWEVTPSGVVTWCALTTAHTPFVHPKACDHLVHDVWSAGSEIRLCETPHGWMCAVKVDEHGFTCVQCYKQFATYAAWYEHYPQHVVIPTTLKWKRMMYSAEVCGQLALRPVLHADRKLRPRSAPLELASGSLLDPQTGAGARSHLVKQLKVYQKSSACKHLRKVARRSKYEARVGHHTRSAERVHDHGYSA